MFRYECANCTRLQEVPSLELAPVTPIGAICFQCAEQNAPQGDPDVADELPPIEVVAIVLPEGADAIEPKSKPKKT